MTEKNNPYSPLLKKYEQWVFFRKHSRKISTALATLAITNLIFIYSIRLYGLFAENLQIAILIGNIVSLVIIGLCILNVIILKSPPKAINNLLLYENLKDVAKISKHDEILTAFFPLVDLTDRILDHRDDKVWVALICSYFQEKNLVLKRTDFIAILKLIYQDAIVKEKYALIGDFKEITENQWQQLEKALPDLDNLIQWQVFYGWDNRPYSSTSPTLYRTPEYIEHYFSRTNQEIFKEIEETTKNRTYTSDTLYLLEENKNIKLDSDKSARQFMELFEQYNPAAMQVRRIIGDYIKTMINPMTAIYPAIGTTLHGEIYKIDDIVENNEEQKKDTD